MNRWNHCLMALAITAPTISACASSSSKGAQPSWRNGDAAPVSRAEPQQLVFAPNTSAVVAYNKRPFVEPRQTVFGDSIVHQISVLSTELGKAPPVPDGRLFAAADDLAAVSPDEGTVAYRLVEFALQRHGIIEPSPHLVVMRASDDDREAVLRELSIRLTSILAESDFARVGVGVAPRPGGESVIVLALQTSAITTQPIPRSVAKNGSVALIGNIHAPYRAPHVYVTRDSGDVETLPLQVGANGAFSTEVGCTGHDGRQQVEITASDHTGSTVLANFPMWCGEKPPASITVEINADGADQFASAGEAEARMVELINRDRKAHGLAPLIADERVAAVSRAHSKDMLETGIVGHVSPNTGNASDRIAAGNVRTAVVLENVARAYGLSEAQDGLMNSPGHRANILSDSATHVGVGIVLGKEVADRREMFITQVFIRIPPALDAKSAIELIAKKLRAERPLTADADLATIAQTFASELAAGSPTREAAARASKTLHERKLRYGGVTTLATTVADLSSFATGGALKDTTITAFGIGVAQGDHPELGSNAISIVVLFGHQ